jgi:hypothetical protein
MSKATTQPPSSPQANFNDKSGYFFISFNFHHNSPKYLTNFTWNRQSTTRNWQDFSPKDIPYQSASDLSKPNDRKSFYNFDEEYRNPVKNVHAPNGIDVEVTEVPNKKLKSSR